MIGLGLALLSNAALALGLGEIKVKSQPGQPLLAEIPVISSEPGELEQLRARLASPVTFERVGLPRPQGLVNELDFAIALDEAGRPVVRVTSRTPVDVPAVNFLIEVDWGQGRLVREYSALVSAPGTLAAAEQPVIDAPAAAPTDTITRPVEPVVTAPTEPAPVPQTAPEAPSRPAPVPAVAATPAPQASPGDTLAPVRRGQSLSQIAAPLAREQGYTLDQAMVALLRANPEAFINGNVNLLKQGAVLRVPEAAEAQTILEGEAAALVRSQIAEWRSARAPIPQPAAVVDATPATTPVAATASRPATVADARLEIAPAATSTSGSGTQSGVSAGGEGEMLANEQLQQSKEDLAAREAEVQELRSQVADLEKLKAQQEKLLAMKDSDLAAAQQRLAQSNGSDGGVPVWAWAGFGLLFVGALAWGFAQRRQRVSPAPVPRNPVFGKVPVDSRAAELAAVMPQATSEAAPAPSPVLEPAVAAPPKSAPPSAPKPAPGPTWHAGGGTPAAPASPMSAPTQMPAPAGRDRLELAVAYLDLGDVATARDLLNEVAAGNDALARDEALQLLRDIG